MQLLPTTPTFLRMLLISGAYKKYDLGSLELITYGTEPMPTATLESLHAAFPGVRLKQTYGLTEVGILPTKSEQDDSLWLAVGGPGYETKIVDNVLWIRAQMAMVGYLNAPSPFDADGWFNTGDVVEQKGDYIRFMGRKSEIINVGGEKVFPGRDRELHPAIGQRQGSDGPRPAQPDHRQCHRGHGRTGRAGRPGRPGGTGPRGLPPPVWRRSRSRRWLKWLRKRSAATASRNSGSERSFMRPAGGDRFRKNWKVKGAS